MNAITKGRRAKPKISIMALEQRMMFDGAAVVDAAHAAADADAKALIPAVTAPTLVREADPSMDNGRKEVAFVDTTVSNWQAIVAGIEATKPGMEIDLVDGGQSGLAQIAKWAESHSGYDAIHVVSGGAEGAIKLGADTVTDTALTSAVGQAELAEIGHSLKSGGEVLVYGKDVGAGTDGQQLLADLAAGTGATIGSSAADPLAISGFMGRLPIGDTNRDTSPAPVMVQAADAAQDGGKLEVAFVDTSATGWQTTVETIRATRPGVEIELIDGTQSGLSQMAAWADNHSCYDSIHIISAGAEGELKIGSDTLAQVSLANVEVRIDLHRIAQSLNSGGQVLLYGADINSGADGKAFLSDLSLASGGTAIGIARDSAQKLADAAPVLAGAVTPIRPATIHGATQVVVVDSTVADWRTLVAGMDPSIPVIVLVPDANGMGELTELAAALSQFHDLESIHVVTEGRTGGIILGQEALWSGDLDTAVVQTGLAAIRGALRPGGDLLLYGCSVAGSETGKQFIDTLAADLGDGVVVAASTDKTGPTRLGGDWDLEYATGAVDVVLPFTLQGMEDIGHCLGCTISSVAATSSGGGQSFSGFFIYNGSNHKVSAVPTGGSQSVYWMYVTSGTPSSYSGYIESVPTAGSFMGTDGGTSAINKFNAYYTSECGGSPPAANAAPTNSVAPALSGGATVGVAFTASNGTWSDADNDTLTYTKQWQVADDSSGTNSADISSATGASFTPTTAQAHKYIRVVVTAADGHSHTPTASSAWTLVADSSPVNTVLPAVSGIATEGQTLTTTNGTWTDADSDTVTYVRQWQRADSNAGLNTADIASATNTTYVTGSSDASKYVRCKVTASDGHGGSTIAYSAWTLISPLGPSVSSISRASAQNVPSATTSVNYTVTFSEAVSGVDASDFTLTATGSASGSIGTPSSSDGGTTWTVAVSSLSGDGTLRLDLNSSGTGIKNGGNADITGGYSSGQTYTIDKVAPTVNTSTLTPSVAENTSSVTWLTSASDTHTITYSKSGTDAALFTLNTSTGALSFTSAPDYEAPGDANADNQYVVTVTATDSFGNATSKNLTVSVTNVNETPVLAAISNFSATERSSAVAIMPSFTLTDDASVAGDFTNAQLVIAQDQYLDAEWITITVNGTASSGYYWDTDDQSADYNAIKKDGTIVAMAAMYNGTGPYGNGDLVINFNANTTAADVQAIARAVEWWPYDNHDPTTNAGAGSDSTPTRTITVTYTDTGGLTATRTATLTINPVNDAPTLSATNSTPTFTENGSGSTLFSGTTIDPIETGESITGMTLTVSGLADGSAEVLIVNGTDVALTAGSGTAGSYSYSVGVSGSIATVTLTRTTSAANWQSLVDGLKYKNTSDNPTVGSGRTVTLTGITDNGGTSNGGVASTTLSIASAVTITAVNDAPVINNLNGDTRSFSIGGSAITLDGATALTVTDPDNAAMASATVVVSGGYHSAEDVLAFTNDGSTMGNISGSWDATSGTLTLTSASASATKAQWAAALKAVTYQDTDGGTTNTAARTVTFTVNDGAANSTSADVTVSLIRAPIIDLDTTNNSSANTSASFTEDGGAVAVTSSNVSISDDGTFKALQVVIDNAQDGGSEVLSSSYGSGSQTVNGEAVTITYTAGSHTLDITVDDGSADAATLQALIQSIRYNNTSHTPNTTARNVTFSGKDNDDNWGSTVTSVVSVTAVNDAPTAGGDDAISLNEGAVVALTTSDLTVSDNDGPAANTLVFTLTSAPTNGTLFVDADSDGVVDAGEAVTTSGARTSFTKQDILDGKVKYRHDGSDTTSDSFTVSLSDGTAAPVTGITVNATVAAVNDEPTLTVTKATSSVYTQDEATGCVIYTAATASAVEVGQKLTSLRLTVSGIQDGNDEILTIDGTDVVLGTTDATNATTSGYNAAVTYGAGTATVDITYSGTDFTASAMQSLITGLRFKDTASPPTVGSRTLTLTRMNDDGGTANGGDDSLVPSGTAQSITVQRLNHAPSLSATGGARSFTEGGSTAVVFSGTSIGIGTNDVSQNIHELTLTISNVYASGGDVLRVDGTDIALNSAGTGTTATNSIAYGVTVDSNTHVATLVLTKTDTASNWQGYVDGARFSNTSDDPTAHAASRVVTITRIQDDGGTAAGGDDDDVPNISATVTLTNVNDAPTLTGTQGSATATFTEGGAGAGLFSGLTIGAGEANDKISLLRFTVTNVTDGASERLVIDGTEVSLTNGTSVTTSGGYGVSVSFSGSTATVEVTKAGNYTTSAATTLLGAMTYKNVSENPSTASHRVVTLTRIQDDGGTSNSGNDTLNPGSNNASDVTVAAVNDAPTLTAGTAAVLYTGKTTPITGLSIADVDAGSSAVQLTITANGGTVTFNGTTAATVTATDTVSALNALLAQGVTFNAGTRAMTATVVVTVSDLGNTGSGGALTASQTVSITVKAQTSSTPPPKTTPPTTTTTTAPTNVLGTGGSNSSGVVTIANINGNSASNTNQVITISNISGGTTGTSGTSGTGTSSGTSGLGGTTSTTTSVTTGTGGTSSFANISLPSAVAPTTATPAATTASTAPATGDGGKTATAATGTSAGTGAATTGTTGNATAGSGAAAPAPTAAISSVPLAPTLSAPTDGGSFRVAVVADSAKVGGVADVVVAKPIGEVSAVDGKVSFSVPSDAFAVTKADASVTLVATQPDGKPLPNWMTFNSSTGTFEGTPPPGEQAVQVKLVARNASGGEAAQVFKVNLAPAANKGTDAKPVKDGKLAFVGRASLTQQLAAAKSGQTAHMAALAKALMGRVA